MQIKQIITQANRSVELEFRAMERSLRASGCSLPLRVIPFDEQRFDLPVNSSWVELKAPLHRLDEMATHPCHRRYGVLTESAYQYTDTDVIFVSDPYESLLGHQGFVTCCTQWRLPHYAVSEQTQVIYEDRSASWPLKVFNSGQFASEEALYDPRELLETLSDSRFSETFFLTSAPWDQPGFNLLVYFKGCSVTNITLPPYNRESSFAGDYPREYRQIWDRSGRPPYLVHWAGRCLDRELPVNELFFSFLSREEVALWKAAQAERFACQRINYRRSLGQPGRAIFDLKMKIRWASPWLFDTLKKRRHDRSD